MRIAHVKQLDNPTKSFQQMNQRTIGILVTNTDNSTFAQNWPRDGEKFSALLKAVRPDWGMKIYDCTLSEFPRDVSDCDGYVIGGSPASVNDNDVWITRLFEFIRMLNNTRTPTVGCCFGHQAIAKALGGTVERNPGGWGFGVSPTHFNVVENWMRPKATTLNLFAAHSEQVTVLPQGARVLGGDDFCPSASLAIGQHFLTTEYHPEMTKPFFIGLSHAFEKYVGGAVAEEARRQAEAVEADGNVFAHWMANFLDQR